MTAPPADTVLYCCAFFLASRSFSCVAAVRALSTFSSSHLLFSCPRPFFQVESDCAQIACHQRFRFLTSTMRTVRATSGKVARAVDDLPVQQSPVFVKLLLLVVVLHQVQTSLHHASALTRPCSVINSRTGTASKRRQSFGIVADSDDCTIRRDRSRATFTRRMKTTSAAVAMMMSDDWSSFTSLDDDDEFIDGKLDTTDYASEEDPQHVKAEVGSSVGAPTIERPAPPIFVPAGTCSDFVRSLVRPFVLLRFFYFIPRWRTNDAATPVTYIHSYCRFATRLVGGNCLGRAECVSGGARHVVRVHGGEQGCGNHRRMRLRLPGGPDGVRIAQGSVLARTDDRTGARFELLAATDTRNRVRRCR